MKINWKSRLKNKTFLVSLFAALLLFAQTVASAIGVDISMYSDKATQIFNALLGVLILIGVVADPNTPGISDNKEEK